jgi:hypothetical protein
MQGQSDRVIQNIVSAYQTRLPSLPLKQLKAIDAIVGCRTTAQGVSAYECEHENKSVLIAHSCRHRSCASCGARQRKQWIEAQKKRLLDVAHFHCVFTLPHEYHTLWRYNQRWFVDTFFDVVRSTLMDSLGDDGRHGITPGVLMAMHTWGRQLSLHPHIHCVITGGGLTREGKWKDTGKYLMPARQVRALYRGRFQDRIKTAYESGELTLPPDKDDHDFKQWQRITYKKPWCVRIEPQYQHGTGVLIYLSKYMRGGPIHPKQIIRCDHERIGFRYTDHRDHRKKVLTLKPREFIRRLLQHVPETGQHMVRHYGLYAGASRVKRNSCRRQVGGLIERAPEHLTPQRSKSPECRSCGSRLRLRWIQHAAPRKANSYRREIRQGDVQQVNEPVVAEAKKTSPRLTL